MAIKQLRNIDYTCNISHVCSVHINSRTLTESLQEPQDAQGTQYISQHNLSVPKLIHNNAKYEII